MEPENCPADDVRDEIICADSADALKTIDDESLGLVVTSPPYNIGKEYELDKRLSLEEYLEWLRPIVKQLCAKVKKNGSICWQVGNYVNKGQVVPLDYLFYQIFIDAGFKMRNRIIWRFNFGLHATNRLSGRYETLLWFTKSDDYTFNLDPIRVPQLYPGKRHSKSKGERAGEPSGNPLGKNPSDYWEFSAEEAFLSDPVWELPNVKANHPEKTPHPCQFPSELVERCILALTNPGDTVLDPFVGAGTTVIASKKHHRHSIGIDQSPEYAKLATERLNDFLEGNLKLRRAGQATRRPKPGEKVSTVPDTWLKTAEHAGDK